MKLLAVSSSQSTQTSVSNGLVDHFVEAWKTRFPGKDITFRNLGETPPPHIDQSFTQAIFTPDDQLTVEHRESLVLSDLFIAELIAADAVVIGVPMHNFTISSPLKTWIDHIVRAGQTFSYGENGPQGLLTGKKVFVLTARGGDYSEGGFMHALDHQEPYLRFILGFLGLGDVTFVQAQGLAMGDDIRDQAISTARAEIKSQVSALGNSLENKAA
jgi:FMN-dependent NADH-azoreductase